eukprot:3758797-Amphidinium_carterae.1
MAEAKARPNNKVVGHEVARRRARNGHAAIARTPTGRTDRHAASAARSMARMRHPPSQRPKPQVRRGRARGKARPQ